MVVDVRFCRPGTGTSVFQFNLAKTDLQRVEPPREKGVATIAHGAGGQEAALELLVARGLRDAVLRQLRQLGLHHLIGF